MIQVLKFSVITPELITKLESLGIIFLKPKEEKFYIVDIPARLTATDIFKHKIEVAKTIEGEQVITISQVTVIFPHVLLDTSTDSAEAYMIRFLTPSFLELAKTTLSNLEGFCAKVVFKDTLYVTFKTKSMYPEFIQVAKNLEGVYRIQNRVTPQVLK